MITTGQPYEPITVNRNNNFDFLRLMFALFVMVTHAYMFTGIEDYDALSGLTNGQLYFSEIGVKGFFIISGYLVYQSGMRSRNVSEYLWRRVLRIYPALIVVLLLIVLLAPFVYESAVPYWKNKSVWTYLPSNLSLYKKQTVIHGVFENNPHGAIVNGNLWTIAYEFFFYLLVGFLIIWKRRVLLMKGAMVMLFVLPLLAIWIWGESLMQYGFILNLYHSCVFATCFFSGAVLAAFRVEQLPAKWRRILILGSIALMVIALAIQVYATIGFLLLPLMVICFGIIATPPLSATGEVLGDLSYGIYIYGGTIQQTLVYYFAPNSYTLMLASIPMAMVFGYASWHLVESKAMRLKNKPWFRSKTPSFALATAHPDQYHSTSTSNQYSTNNPV